MEIIRLSGHKLFLVWTFILSAQALLFETQNQFPTGFENGVKDSNNLFRLARRLGDTQVAKLVERVGLTPTLRNRGPLTFFAPTNEACQSISDEMHLYLAENKTALAQTLAYHVIADAVHSDKLHNEMLLPTLNGNNIRINIYHNNGKVITASGARVTLPDQQASNGILHEINRLMLPPIGTAKHAIRTNAEFSILSRVIMAAGLYDILDDEGPFTFLAPTDDAFASLPLGVLDHLLNNTQLLQDTLAYHALMGTHYSAGFADNAMLRTAEGKPVLIHFEQGGAVFVNDARIVQADVTVTNGCIHAIDKVLLHDELHFELVYNRR